MPADDDWDHALGSIYTLLWEGDMLVGHASVVQRRLFHTGRALQASYVECVAVCPRRRRQGHGAAMMTEIIDLPASG